MNTSLLPLIRSTTRAPLEVKKENAPTCPFCNCNDVRRVSGMMQSAASPAPSSTDAPDRSQPGYAINIFKGTPATGLPQTHRMVPPPVPRGTRVFLVSLICLGVLIGALSLMGSLEVGYGIFAAAMVVVAVFSLVQCKNDEQAFTTKIRQWENSWCCLRCGRSFMK